MPSDFSVRVYFVASRQSVSLTIHLSIPRDIRNDEGISNFGPMFDQNVNIGLLTRRWRIDAYCILPKSWIIEDNAKCCSLRLARCKFSSRSLNFPSTTVLNIATYRSTRNPFETRLLAAKDIN